MINKYTLATYTVDKTPNTPSVWNTQPISLDDIYDHRAQRGLVK